MSSAVNNNWKCPLCSEGDREFKVRVVSNGKIIHVCSSILKAENYAFKNATFPCIIRFSYICNRCQNESKVSERVYRGF